MSVVTLMLAYTMLWVGFVERDLQAFSDFSVVMVSTMLAQYVMGLPFDGHFQ
jgi:hypothetical protein